MTHWRMQIHPAAPSRSVKHSVESLSAGYIGLDFEEDIGDLMTVAKDTLPKKQLDYWAFAQK